MKACPRCNLRYPDDSTVCFVDGTALVPMRDPRVGTTIAGRYLVESVLAEGGMAIVYKARHRLVDRPCAIKVMSASLARSEVVRERFRREAKAAQSLAHPNIIEIFDTGDTDDGLPFLVMEYLEGEPLDATIGRGPLAIAQALPIMVQMARALSRAHDFEVIHRDLKPENIFLCDAGGGAPLVKLLDFGIARSMHAPRLTSIGEIFGTPQYMAPERISSIDAGPSADLYSLGVICFEMLAGCLPYEADDPATYFARHMTAPVPSLASIGVRVPSLLDALVKSLMAKKPVERPVDAHRVLADLTRAASEAGVAIPSDPVEAPPSSWQAPKTLPPVGIEQWVRRTVVFEQMLQRAYRSKPPAEASSRLARIRESVGEIASLRSRGVEAQNELEALEAQEREGRQRLGFAVDALGVDLSRAREEARAARALADASAARIKAHTARMRELQREIGFWEGRSAFVEPYRELAAAYRAAADEVEAWMVHRDEDVQERAVAEQADLVVADLEYQIHELRAGLVRLEQTMARQREQIEARLADLGRRADEMEGELLRLATELCEPIRKNPAVASLFRELEESR